MSGSRQTFLDSTHQAHFVQYGYAIVNIDPRLPDVLEQIYRTHPPQNDDGLQLSLKETDPERKLRLHRLATGQIAPALKNVLNNYKIIASGFINKLPGKVNTSGLHRDPSFVDESRFNTLLLWCPLVDTHLQNGPLGVVPCSNQLFKGFKGMVFGKYDFSGEELEIQKKFGKTLLLKKGQAVIFDTALLHYSGQNLSDSDRPVLSAFLIPAEAETLCYHYNAQQNTTEAYAATEQLLLNYYQQYMNEASLPFPLKSSRTFSPPQKVGLARFEAAKNQSASLLSSLKNFFLKR